MKLLLLLLSLSTLLITNSCQKREKLEEKSQVLHLNLTDDPISLDPRSVRNLRDLTLMLQLYEGLMRTDSEGIPQPALAEKIEISNDSLTYTFYLREAYWTNLDPVTAYDFEYSWKKILEPNFKCDYAHMLYPILNAKNARSGHCETECVGIKAIDSQTLRIQLDYPTHYFLELLSLPIFFPINHKVDLKIKNWSSPLGEQCVCNGPFYLKQWSPQEELTLEKNPTYWDCHSVYLDQILFSLVSDSCTESYLFEKEQLDWWGQPISNNIATEALGKLKERGELESYSVAGTCWLKFNTEKAPFNHEKLRKAFSYAIHRQEIITHVLQGKQSVATGPLPPSLRASGLPHFKDGDTQLAEQLFEEVLAEQGWTRNTFPKIILNYPPAERATKIVQLVQQQWQTTFGIDIELISLEGHLYRRTIKEGLYQVGMGDWIADFQDPLTFLELFKYKNDVRTGNGMNDTGWQNDAFIALLDQSQLERDPKRRGELLNAAEKILVEEMPIAPLYYYAFDYVKKPYVHNVILSPLGIADFKSTRLQRP